MQTYNTIQEYLDLFGLESIEGQNYLQAYLVALNYENGKSRLSAKSYFDEINSLLGINNKYCTRCKTAIKQQHNQNLIYIQTELMKYPYMLRISGLRSKEYNDYYVKSINIGGFNIINNNIKKIKKEYVKANANKLKTQRYITLKDDFQTLEKFKNDRLRFFDLAEGHFIKYLNTLVNTEDVKSRKVNSKISDGELLACVESGMTAKDIAAKYDVSLSYVYRRKRDLKNSNDEDK